MRPIILKWLVPTFSSGQVSEREQSWGVRGAGTGGAEGGGVDFLYFIFYILIYAMEIERGQRDIKRKHY